MMKPFHARRTIVSLLLIAPLVLVSAPGASSATPSLLGHPCAVLTHGEVSAALGAPASKGFAVGSNRTNASLGGPITGPKNLCRYHASTGSVDVTIDAYPNARAKFLHERSLWFPHVDLSGIGDSAFYIGGSAIYVLKGSIIYFVSLEFKNRVANPRVSYPQLVTLAKLGASRI